ncbi:MAG: AAA family ATPase [Gaiellaceae bacterium]
MGRHSLTLLGALGGHGKTTLAVDLFLHLAAGIDYAPFTVPGPVSILMIENEGPEELFAEKLAGRLAHFPHELKARLDVCTFDWGGFSLADASARQRLTREIAEKRYDLIFGDPLDSLGIEGVGSPEDTRRFLALMKETGLNQTVAWWLNTHPRKEETKEALNEISGAWGGKPDSVLLLRMLEDDRTRVRFPPPPSSSSTLTRTRTRARPSRAARSSAHGQKIDHEDEWLVRLDRGARSSRSVGHGGRDRESAPAADLHPEDARVPARNDLALAELELERTPPVPGGVELLARGEGDPDVVHRDLCSVHGLGPVADRDVLDAELERDVALRLLDLRPFERQGTHPF